MSDKKTQKKRNKRWELEMDEDYYNAIKNDPEAAKFLLEFNRKYHLGDNDKPTDIIAPRSKQQKKADYRRHYVSRNDVLNIAEELEDELKDKKK